MDITIWMRDDTAMTPVGEMIGSLRIGEYGGGHIVLHSILGNDQIAIWKKLRDACEEQIRRLTESATKAESEKAAEEKSVNGQTKDEKNMELAGRIVDGDAFNKFEALDNGGYLSPGPSIEPLPESHKSAAAVIEEDIPVPQRIDEAVRTLKIPPPPDVDIEYPF